MYPHSIDSLVWRRGDFPVTSLYASAGQGAAYLVGTGTSVRAPSMTACCSLTKAMKGISKKSTSPTSTLEASASRGSFFMNLFFSCVERVKRKPQLTSKEENKKKHSIYHWREFHYMSLHTTGFSYSHSSILLDHSSIINISKYFKFKNTESIITWCIYKTMFAYKIIHLLI